MFDKLIESDSAGAEFKNRRKFFMTSAIVVGILFISAVVFDLYAANIDLGTDNFELTELLAPITPDAPDPEPPRQQPQQRNEQTTSDLPTRQQLIARIDQPQQAPTSISTTQNPYRSIPDGAFRFDPSAHDSDGAGSTAPAGNPNGSGSAVESSASETVKAVEPPPAVAKVEPARPTTKTLGVINGRATYLPNPPYPAPARAVGAAGIVNVQVTIDEAGKVISSKAVSGHPLLRGTAESAAWKARFSPTLLSNVPVKVSGVIVFNFKKS
jgi:TonB family protein